MRKRAKWMNKASDPVLEVLKKSGIAVSRAAVNNEIQKTQGSQPSRATIYRAFEPLSSHGLIRSESRGGSEFYQITAKGEKYLSGELDASELTADNE